LSPKGRKKDYEEKKGGGKKGENTRNTPNLGSFFSIHILGTRRKKRRKRKGKKEERTGEKRRRKRADRADLDTRGTLFLLEEWNRASNSESNLDTGKKEKEKETSRRKGTRGKREKGCGLRWRFISPLLLPPFTLYSLNHTRELKWRGKEIRGGGREKKKGKKKGEGGAKAHLDLNLLCRLLIISRHKGGERRRKKRKAPCKKGEKGSAKRTITCISEKAF